MHLFLDKANCLSSLTKYINLAGKFLFKKLILFYKYSVFIFPIYQMIPSQEHYQIGHTISVRENILITPMFVCVFVTTLAKQLPTLLGGLREAFFA